MPLSAEERRKLHRATQCAMRWHADHHRKGTQIPYLSHLLQVEGLVLEYGGGVDQAIAALLHDCLEDAESLEQRAERESQIADEFGEAVLAIVLVCTDTRSDEALESKRPWKERKERYIAALRKTDDASLLVAVCDKQHNLHSLVWDVRSQGLGYLDRFTGRPEEQLWYFEEVVAIARGRAPARLVMELEDGVSQLRDLIQAD